MLIIILVILGLSLLILGHEAGHFFAAKAFGLNVEEFGFGFPPRITAWKRDGTEYSLNWLPFGGFVKLGGERGEFAMLEAKDEPKQSEPSEKAVHESKQFYAQPAWKKSVVMLAGVVVNLILGWLFVSLTLMIGAPKALVIAGIEANSPAAQAGIMTNDIVKGFTTAQDFKNYVNANLGKPITVGVLRNNKEIDFTVTPRTQTGAGQGAIGVLLEEAGTQSEGFFAALRDGAISTVALLWLTIQAFGQLITQLFVHASLLPGVVGPVGIVGVAQETGKIGLVYLLQFFGIISINLAIVNLIPFPALDGGRFVLAIVEKIKGSAIPYKVEAWLNGLGFSLLIILMILLTIRDVGNLL